MTVIGEETLVRVQMCTSVNGIASSLPRIASSSTVIDEEKAVTEDKQMNK